MRTAAKASRESPATLSGSPWKSAPDVRPPVDSRAEDAGKTLRDICERVEIVDGNAIVVEGLRKHFGDVNALDGIDFQVAPQSVFGLLGPNGAGKTTAVRVLATVLRPDGGRAEVLGHDVVKEPEAVRRRIGLAGQNAAVDPNLTGRENLRMVGLLGQLPRLEIMPRAAELLERFGLSEAADRPLRTYSGGMRRRLDVAA